MIKSVDTKKFLSSVDEFPVIDVRSPSEFYQGHIPGAYNIPLFNDEERKEVGTLYKQSGKEVSIIKGLEIVGPKMVDIVKLVQEITPQKKILIHCWRGGLRSQSMAWLYSTAGYEVGLLEGGYKSYRNYIRKELSKIQNLIVLSGETGSGKTEILHELLNMGEQIIDLEGLAHHKGSAFGSLGENPQPTNEQFENNLYHEWAKLNHDKIIFIEDESSRIGRVVIQPEIFTVIRSSPAIKLEMNKSLRIERLVKDYTNFDKSLLIERIKKISKRLGGQHVNIIIEAIQKNDFRTAIDMVLVYYDKTYAYGLSKRDPELIKHIETRSSEAVINAKKVLSISKTI